MIQYYSCGGLTSPLLPFVEFLGEVLVDPLESELSFCRLYGDFVLFIFLRSLHRVPHPLQPAEDRRGS